MAAPILPLDVVFEILTWLSVESLLRIKSVCRDWRYIIEDPKFIKKHLRRGQRFSIGYVYRDMILPSSLATPAIYDLVNDVYVTMCDCRGLSLQRTLVSSKYFIRNPATRQILDLPDPYRNSLAMSFAYVKSTDEYKVVSLYPNPDQSSGEKCEVLAIVDHGDLAWKQIEMPDLVAPDCLDKKLVMVTTTKAVHFVKLVTTFFFYYVQVDSLDLVTDTFTTAILPISVFSDLGDLRAFNVGGCLGIGTIDTRNKNLQILTLKDHRQSAWADSLVVYPLRCLDPRDVKRATPLFIRKGILWLWVAGEKLISYDTKTNTVINTEVAPEGMSISSKIVLNSSTLVSLKGMRPDTNPSMLTT